MGDEKNRMDLDMLARLDSTGKRRGKVVNYEMSETRAISVMESVCPNMQDYERTECKPPTMLCSRFAKKAGIIQRGAKKDASKTLAAIDSPRKMLEQQLTVFCESLLEEHEDDISDQIRSNVTEGRSKLCVGQRLCTADQLQERPAYIVGEETKPAKAKAKKGK